MTVERDLKIHQAWVDALAGRDPTKVSVMELVPQIKKAVPGVTLKEIAASLARAADRYYQLSKMTIGAFAPPKKH